MIRKRINILFLIILIFFGGWILPTYSQNLSSGIDVKKILKIEEPKLNFSQKFSPLEEKLLQKALSFYNQGDFNRAELLVTQILKRIPSSYRSYFLLYKIKEKLGEEDSLFYLKKAKMIFDSLKEREKLSFDKLDDSFYQEFNKYLDNYTLSYKFYQRALQMLQSGKWERAASLIEEAISLKKKPFYYFKLADIYVDMGEKMTAAKYYREGLLLQDDDKAKLKLVEILLNKGLLSEAKPYLESLYFKYPNNRKILAMYNYLKRNLSKLESRKSLSFSKRGTSSVSSSANSFKLIVEEFSGRDLILKPSTLKTLDYREFVFKKFPLYDKITGIQKGKVLIMGKRGANFKGFLLTGNKLKVQKGDYLQIGLD